MITVRKIDEEEAKSLFDFYQDIISEVSSKHEFIAAMDNNDFLGFSQIAVGQEIAEIINIYVNESERGQGLGDGLLRTTLNYFEKNGYLWTIAGENKHLNEFLRKEGFVLLGEAMISEDIKDLMKHYNPLSTYYCNIPLFFNKGCKYNKS